MPEPTVGDGVDGLMEMKKPEPNPSLEAREGLPRPSGLVA